MGLTDGVTGGVLWWGEVRGVGRTVRICYEACAAVGIGGFALACTTVS